MKKVLFLFSLLFVCCLFSKAQFKQIAAGPEFNEPYSSSSRLLLMKKGNLIFADVGFRDSIRIRVYNTAHQEIAVTSYEMSSYGKRTYLGLNAAFEINGEAVFFINAEVEKARVLYLVIVDPNTGQVKKEEKIFGLIPLSKNDRYGVWQGNFFISKAAGSDDYAIAYCNNLESDKTKNIVIRLFNKEHAEVGRSSYKTAEKEFESFKFIDLSFIGPEKVGLLLVGSPWKDGDRKMFFALMKKGSYSLSITPLNFPPDETSFNISAKMEYCSYSRRIVVAIGFGYYKVNPYLCFLDPEIEKAGKMMKVDFSDALHEKATDIHGKRYTFFGKPVKLLTGKNGNFSVVYEEDADEITGGGSHSYTSDIIVADFDKNSKLLSNYMVPRKIFLNPSTSMNYGGGFGNNYTEFAYIKNNDKAFVFFNDLRENIERLEKNKDPKQVVVVKDCDAFYFPLTGNEPIPSRKYLYGETSEKEDHIQSPFGVSAYDKENDLFITLRLNRDDKKRTKTVNVVWLKPQ